MALDSICITERFRCNPCSGHLLAKFWAVELLAQALFFMIGIGFLVLVVLYAIDRLQTHDPVRRNEPMVSRFRALFTNPGEFFRQYFFAMDRKELPFNRAQRDWVKRSASGLGNTVPSGRPGIWVLLAPPSL